MSFLGICGVIQQQSMCSVCTRPSPQTKQACVCGARRDGGGAEKHVQFALTPPMQKRSPFLSRGVVSCTEAQKNFPGLNQRTWQFFLQNLSYWGGCDGAQCCPGLKVAETLSGSQPVVAPKWSAVKVLLPKFTQSQL